jgi:hypothetical protein
LVAATGIGRPGEPDSFDGGAEKGSEQWKV